MAKVKKIKDYYKREENMRWYRLDGNLTIFQLKNRFIVVNESTDGNPALLNHPELRDFNDWNNITNIPKDIVCVESPKMDIKGFVKYDEDGEPKDTLLMKIASNMILHVYDGARIRLPKSTTERLVAFITDIREYYSVLEE